MVVGEGEEREFSGAGDLVEDGAVGAAGGEVVEGGELRAEVVDGAELAGERIVGGGGGGERLWIGGG